MTAAAALVLGGVATDLRDGAAQAAQAIDTGAAEAKLELLIDATVGTVIGIGFVIGMGSCFRRSIAKETRSGLAEAKENEPLDSQQWKAAARREIVSPHLLRRALQNDGVKHHRGVHSGAQPSKGVIPP
jgi:hypothetical protein